MIDYHSQMQQFITTGEASEEFLRYVDTDEATQAHLDTVVQGQIAELVTEYQRVKGRKS